MKLRRFLLRYYPPGIILEYESNEELKQKTIDLLELSVEYVYHTRVDFTIPVPPNYLKISMRAFILDSSGFRKCMKDFLLVNFAGPMSKRC